jgi:hypothetical protein
MITNKGKQLLTKYMVGQSTSYAAYIALGCGPTPYDSNTSVSQADNEEHRIKNNLEFEMFRVPIISKGYLTEESGNATITGASHSNGIITYTANNDFVAGDTVTISGITPLSLNTEAATILEASSTTFSVGSNITDSYTSGGVAKTYFTDIIFTAELPTEERYEITEIGVFPAQSNPDAGAYDSRTLYSFSQSENWQYHGSSIDRIPTIYTPLDPNTANLIEGTYTVDGVSKDCKVFHTNATNTLFANKVRVDRYETCRYLNNIVAIRGNTADLSYNNSTKRITVESGDHIHLAISGLNLDKNSPADEIRLAFSVINTRGAEADIPEEVNIVVEFSVDDSTNAESAKMEIHLSADDYNFITNRYFVVSKKISELITSANFSWSQVKAVRVYASVSDTDGPTDLFYIGLDALRLENTQTINPLYGLTAYSVVKTSDSATVKKLENTTNYIEFRFGMDV